MLALLAPVPDEHLRDALRVCAEHGRVAFGSGWPGGDSSGAGAWEFFSGLKADELLPLPAFIYASSTRDVGPLEYHRRGQVTFSGRLISFDTALSNGKCKRPELRPLPALSGDSAATIFWEVADLRHLSPKEQFSYSKLKRVSGRKQKGTPIADPLRGPMRVLVPKEYEHLLN